MRAVLLLAIAAVTPLPTAAAVIHFDCRFSAACSYANGCTQNAALNLEFDLDTAARSAAVVEDGVRSEAAYFTGHDAMTFVERLATGAARTTTIARSLFAVHSRHAVSPGGAEIVPVQFYGKCEEA